MTVLDTQTGTSVTLDFSEDEALNSHAELETFLAERGIGATERAAQKKAGAERLAAEDTHGVENVFEEG